MPLFQANYRRIGGAAAFSISQFAGKIGQVSENGVFLSVVIRKFFLDIFSRRIGFIF